jgi:CRISPR type III-B/RAMP module RAMP protein Cmr1
MIAESIIFECLTPCFCAGADQSIPEIRPSAIRGALRWWFRALGGTRDQECVVFGGSETLTASSLRLRVKNVTPKSVGHLPQPKGIDPLSYILYFPSVSSEKTRWNPKACFGAETTFSLELQQLRSIPTETSELLNNTVKAFCHYGSIGMHITRGLGAIQARKVTEESFKDAEGLLGSAGFTVRKSPRPHNEWEQVLKEAGQWLQGDLRKEWGAGGNKKPPQATALGSTSLPESKLRQNNWSQVPRQTSAVYLRPYRNDARKLILVAFEAPHRRVLGEQSRKAHTEPILLKKDFFRPLPPPPQGGSNHGRRY